MAAPTNTTAASRLLRGLAGRLRSMIRPPGDAEDGFTGTCGLCGKRRHDLGDDGLCRKCSMAAW